MLPPSRAFDNAYDGTPTWDIGRPQPAVLRMLEEGLIGGDVLDVGCGTGEHARLLASLGHRVLGIDFSARAIERAQVRSPEPAEGAPLAFRVADVLELAGLDRTFDTVLDVGCFHTLQPEDRTTYAASIRGVLRPGGRLLLLCWSDRNAFGYGPARIRRRDLATTFGRGWTLESVTAETLDSRLESGRVHAWRAIATPTSEVPGSRSRR